MTKHKIINLEEYADEILAAATDTRFIDEHRLTMIEWTSERHIAALEAEGDYAGPMDGWRLTTSDYWISKILDRINDAADKGDEDAMLHFSLTHAASHLSEVGRNDLADVVYEEAFKLESRWEPTGIDALLPRHSCHFVWLLQLILADIVFPESNWLPVGNDLHSFIQSDTGEIFDLLLFDDYAGDSYYDNATPLLDSAAA